MEDARIWASAALEPACGHGSSAVSKLSIWAFLSSLLDPHGIVVDRWRPVDGLGDGSCSRAAPYLGWIGDRTSDPQIEAEHLFSDRQFIGVRTIRLPGGKTGLLEHQLCCRVAALGAVFIDT